MGLEEHELRSGCVGCAREASRRHFSAPCWGRALRPLSQDLLATAAPASRVTRLERNLAFTRPGGG
jgi:hypothetical protein